MSSVTYFNIASEAWGMLLCLTCLICAMMLTLDNSMTRHHFSRMFFIEIFVLGSDIVSVAMDGREGAAAHILVLGSNTLLFFASLLLLVCYTDYIEELVLTGEHWRFPLFKILRRVLFLEMFIDLFNLFIPVYFSVGSDNVYHRAGFFFLTQVTGIIVAVCVETVVIIYRKKIARSTLVCVSMYTVAPIFALAVQIRFYGLSLLNIVTTFLLMVFFISMMLETNRTIYNQKIELAQKEAELTENKTQIMLSQIQPHFLYNSLNSIYYLCGKNPKLAQKAVGDFSDYIRMNLDALKTKENIPFTKELEHIKTYLWLEQLRFDDRLKIEYDIQTADFVLPVLSVQPMVENAVKHGVCRKPEGGTVWLSTMDMGDHVQILVKDDGVGFDVNSPAKADGRSHIGLQNVRQRLKDEIGGSIDIVSVSGEGTTVTIEIPKQ